MKTEMVDVHSAVTRAAYYYLEAAGSNIEEAAALIQHELHNEHECLLCPVLATWVMEEARDILRVGENEPPSAAS